MPRNKLSKFDRELREIISNNLKKYASNLTQNQLSDITGIPTSTLSGYFSKRSTPDAGNVQKMADALHINKSDIDPRFSEGFSFEKASKYGINKSADYPDDDYCSLKCTQDEKVMVKKYRCLTPEGKETVDTILDLQYKAVAPKVKNESAG
jgi:transcriptional regulator with XRE-family HTH domain